MNVVFLLIALISIVMLAINSPDSILPSMMGGVTSAVTLAFRLLAIYCVWLSVLKMVQSAKIDIWLTKMLKPIIKKLFKKENEEAYNWIAINITADMLGMGGVATKAGMKAIEKMNCTDNKASNNMILLLVISATTIQIMPSSIIAIRAQSGSTNSADIYLPTLIATLIATIVGIVLCKIIAKISSKRKTDDIDTTNTLSSQNCNIKPVYSNLTQFSKRLKHR